MRNDWRKSNFSKSKDEAVNGGRNEESIEDRLPVPWTSNSFRCREERSILNGGIEQVKGDTTGPRDMSTLRDRPWVSGVGLKQCSRDRDLCVVYNKTNRINEARYSWNFRTTFVSALEQRLSTSRSFRVVSNSTVVVSFWRCLIKV